MKFSKGVTVALPEYENIKLIVVDAPSFEECDKQIINELKRIGIPVSANITKALQWQVNFQTAQQTPTPAQEPSQPPAQQPTATQAGGVLCSVCSNKKITKKVYDYSIDFYGKALCYDCQNSGKYPKIK